MSTRVTDKRREKNMSKLKIWLEENKKSINKSEVVNKTL
jgi:hypothetical protein